jgi:hypothetical protein
LAKRITLLIIYTKITYKNFFKQIEFSGEIFILDTLDHISVVNGIIMDEDAIIHFGKNITPRNYAGENSMTFFGCNGISIEFGVLKTNKFQQCHI